VGHCLIISEKPQAAQRIAEALAEGSIDKISKRGAYWFEFERNGKKCLCVPAVGHLFVLDTKKSKGWEYPTFDVHWVPTCTRKGSEYTKKYLGNLQELSKGVDEFIVSTDYDIEGEVIGFNILRFLCKTTKAKRMKFSTLTKSDLVEAYDNAMPTVDRGQAEAGLTRHFLDFFWGINTTRALTLAMRKFLRRRFTVVSSGRVQSPTLKILVDRELEIKKFVAIPFWQLHLHCLHGSETLIAVYEKDKVWEKTEAQQVFDTCTGKDAVVQQIKKRSYKNLPPTPFDTTSLQTESYRCFGLSPTETMAVAEALYNQALISYPRTSSQKLPAKIGLKKILQNLSKNPSFKNICQELLSKGKLKPREGKRTDPAHVAIYPTGERPKALNATQQKMYNLIVKRFLALFGEPAIREAVAVVLDVSGRKFLLSGIRTIEPGWTNYYKEFVRLKEQLLPALNKGDVLKNKKLEILDKETQPPKRYTQGSIVKQMEKLGLGTKATRANILQTLYNRSYIKGKTIEVTGFGERVADVLEKFCPRIISVELTRKFEDEMELVRQLKKERETVVGEVKGLLTETMAEFKDKEEDIGKALAEAYESYEKKESYLGKCLDCDGDLRIIVNPKTRKRFCGCSNYSKGCRFSTPLPQRGSVKALDKTCEECGFPLIAVRFRRKWFESCLNMKCKTKEKK